MKKTALKISVFYAILLWLIMVSNLALAAEVTGTLDTGFGGDVDSNLNGTVGGNSVTGTVVVPPSASPAAGSYSATQNVALSAAGSANIRYTVDGTSPTCLTGSAYASAIAITSTKTLKTISCYSGGGQSSVASFIYTLSSIETTTDVVLASTGAGESASMPTGITSLKLDNNTALDVSASISAVVAGSVTIGGVTKAMESFTSGNLSSVNLSAPVKISDQEITIGKAVEIKSGVADQPIVLTNKDLTNASVSIPDKTTILAPAGWDGEIKPPKAGSSSGSAPSGFSVGSTVIEIGSPAGVLLFDKPVAIVLSAVTGIVAYKASGSSIWTKIANTCGGNYDSPSAPSFPDECYISNGTDTKIYTYHFTTFASLNAVSNGTSSGSGGGGGGGGSYTPTITTSSLSAAAQKVDANKDNKIDLFDFNILMVKWGVADSGNAADFNSDGKVDIFDFNLLMVNWTG